MSMDKELTPAMRRMEKKIDMAEKKAKELAMRKMIREEVTAALKAVGPKKTAVKQRAKKK